MQPMARRLKIYMNRTIYGTYLHTKFQHIDIVERLHLKFKIKRDLPAW